MRKELQDRLVAHYPALFREIHMSPRESAMGRGIEVDDGWYTIIDQMCCKLAELDIPDMRFVQIKEKFGYLRTYIDFGDTRAADIVEWAERASGVTCERCGEPGEMRSGEWLEVRCDKCEADHAARED